MPARNEVDAPPEEFRKALDQLRSARLRPEIFSEEMPAPQRIAPYSAAITADVTVAGEEVGGGRLVLLYDPTGNDAWQGVFRCVAYARADIDPEMVTDPLLSAVGWTWLIESLTAHGAEYLAPSGTVTRVASESFEACRTIRPTPRSRCGPRGRHWARSVHTSRHGATCSARLHDSRRYPQAWSRCPTGAANGL